MLSAWGGDGVAGSDMGARVPLYTSAKVTQTGTNDTEEQIFSQIRTFEP